MSIRTHHRQFEELLAPYALDAVDAREATTIEKHLDRCEPCREEVWRFRESIATLSAPIEPPLRLWASIREATRSRTKLPRPRLQMLAVAASIAILLGAASYQTLRTLELGEAIAESQGEIDRLNELLAAGSYSEMAEAAMASPRATTVSLRGDATGTVILLPDGTGVLIAHDFDRLDPSLTYQLWAVQAGEVISAGILGSEPGIVPFHIDPVRLEGLVVTVENAGGVAVSGQDAYSSWSPEA